MRIRSRLGVKVALAAFVLCVIALLSVAAALILGFSQSNAALSKDVAGLLTEFQDAQEVQAERRAADLAEQARAMLAGKARSLAGTLDQIAAAGLWNFDNAVLNQCCEQACKDSDVALCVVVDAAGKIQTEFGNGAVVGPRFELAPDCKATAAVEALRKAGVTELPFPLASQDGKKLGQLIFFLLPDSVDRQVKAVMQDKALAMKAIDEASKKVISQVERSAAVQAKSGVKSAAVASMIAAAAVFLLLLGMTLYLTNPLTRMVPVLRDISIGKLSADISGATLSRADEVGAMARSVAELADSLRKKAAAAAEVAQGHTAVELIIASEHDLLGHSLQSMILALRRMVGDVNRIAHAAVQGELDIRADSSTHEGDFRLIVTGFNSTLDAMTGPLKAAASHISRIAVGDLPGDLPNSFQGEFKRLAAHVNACSASLRALEDNLNEVITAQAAGQLDTRCRFDNLQGSYMALAMGMNKALDTVCTPLVDASSLMKRYAQGDLSTPMRSLPGRLVLLTEGLNGFRKAVISVIEDTERLARSALDGRLDVRADVSAHHGDYARIVSGVNAALNAVVEPLNNVSAVLAGAARHDLSGHVDATYNGQLEELKLNVNYAVSNLDGALREVSDVAESIAQGADGITSSSHALSEGAAEQAASLEQITSSIGELTSKTRANAGGAAEASRIAKDMCAAAEDGLSKMSGMSSSMTAISESSHRISKIIKVIDDIAFQTNLLALNAAVEAARAGRHGKGFAVVADEVRNLAGRSAKAARETSEIIDDALNKVSGGIATLGLTRNSLDAITAKAVEVNGLAAKIAADSGEQATEIDLINKGLTQVGQVTQVNAAHAESTASSAAELMEQSTQLNTLLARFKLSDGCA